MRFSDAIQDPDWLHAVLQNSLRDALIRHKAFGVAIAVWRDNDVVLPDPIPDKGIMTITRAKD